jgi:putative DNA primase/helicase
MTAASEHLDNPFASGWRGAYDAGWHPIPLPPGAKWPPPKGTTGADGRDYSYADLTALEDNGHNNLGARFPANVIGLDWDVRKGALGFRELTAGLQIDHVPYFENGRGDGSGIYLWRLAPDMDESHLGDSIEGVDIIRRGHRYAVIPPSLHPEGRRYIVSTGEMPRVSDLPPLPRLLWDRLPKKAAVSPAGTGDARCLTGGQPCRVVQAKLDALIAGPWTDRHNHARDGVGALVRLGEAGHVGVKQALTMLEKEFQRQIRGERGRNPYEWALMVGPAVEKIGGSADDDDRNGCGDGACGVLDLLGAIPPGQQQQQPTRNPGDPNPLFIFGKTVDPHAIFLAMSSAYPLLIDDTAAHNLWGYQGGVWRMLGEDPLVIKQFLARELGRKFTLNALGIVREYARGNAPMFTPGHDSPPNLWNIANGMLDWETGELTPHGPEYLSTIQFPVHYDPRATCPNIDAWLAEVLPGDLLVPDRATGRVFIDEVLGYLLGRGNPFHKAFLLLGTGRNGKGTFLRLIQALIGKNNISSVTLHDLDGNRFKPAELYGKQANIAGDLDSKRLESTANFKMLTGGDEVTVERKHGHPFQFTVEANMLFSANAVFGTPDTSDGYMSRWVIIPFPKAFTGREDRTLDERLATPGELSGLLNRALRGARSLQGFGNFMEPPAMAEARDDFERQSDHMREFVHQCMERGGSGLHVKPKLVHDLYEVWCVEEGIRNPLPKAKFYAALERVIGVRKKLDGAPVFRGVRLTKKVDVLQGGIVEEVPLATPEDLL